MENDRKHSAAVLTMRERPGKELGSAGELVVSMAMARGLTEGLTAMIREQLTLLGFS